MAVEFTPTFTVSNTYVFNGKPLSGYSGDGAGMRDGFNYEATSIWGANYSTDPRITADLGVVKKVTRVGLRAAAGNAPGSWGAQYSNNCTIDYSADGVTWFGTTLVQNITNEGDLFTYDYGGEGATCRYVRVTKYGEDYLAFGEFRVYGEEVNPPISGTADTTLGALTATASGKLPVAAQSSPTLDLLTSISAGKLALTATGSGQLGALTATSAAVLALTAHADITLGELALTGVAGAELGGVVVGVLEPLTAEAAGSLLLQAQANLTLGTLISVSSGRSNAAPEGYLDGRLAPLTLEATGSLRNAADADLVLEPLVGASTGNLRITGAADVLLGVLTSLSAGSTADAEPTKGESSGALAPLVLEATGALLLRAEVDVVLGLLTLRASDSLPVAISRGRTIVLPAKRRTLRLIL